MTVPNFKIRCFLVKREGKWHVKALCSCHNPNSLFCYSLFSLCLSYWLRIIARYMRRQIDLDPSPYTPITDLDDLRIWNGYFVSYGLNPLSCLQYILNHKAVKNHHAVGYCPYAEKYYFYITPSRVSYSLRLCFKQFSKASKWLPFDLYGDVHPHFKFVQPPRPSCSRQSPDASNIEPYA